MSDLISRQAAIDAIEAEKTKRGDYLTSSYVGYEMAEKVVKQLPPIQPKRGKWIKTARWGRVYYCDQCRNYLDFDGVNAGRGSANFCPNCGADMRERKERTVRAIDADALQRAIVEEGQANKRKKYVIGDIWELTGAEIRDVINSQPTIQPEPHWISVTERLPEKHGAYIVCYSDFRHGIYYGRVIAVAWFDVEDTWLKYRYADNARTFPPRLHHVIAWMPLPEPYKGVTT